MVNCRFKGMHDRWEYGAYLQSIYNPAKGCVFALVCDAKGVIYEKPLKEILIDLPAEDDED